MHEFLVNCLVKLTQENVWLGDLTIAVDWDVKPRAKQNLYSGFFDQVRPNPIVQPACADKFYFD